MGWGGRGGGFGGRSVCDRAGGYPSRGGGWNPWVVVGRPEREEGDESVAKAMEAVAEYSLSRDIGGCLSGGGGSGGVDDGGGERGAERLCEISEERHGEEREDDEDEEKHQYQVA